MTATFSSAPVVHTHFPLSTPDGEIRVRVDRPERPGRLPAVLFIQGFDTGPMEGLDDHPYGRFIARLAGQGFAVMRAWRPVPRAGTAGLSPREADLADDLRLFEAALRRLKELDFVDPDRVFLFGHSLGGLVAPLLALQVPVLGIAVYGTSLKPWRELIPEAFRVQGPLLGADPVENERLVGELRDLMVLFYRDRKSPAEIEADARCRDILREHLQHDGHGHLWGRHYRYWQQLDDHDMTGVWSRTGAHVLSMFGQFDLEVFSDLEARSIADIVNHHHPGHGRFLQIDGVNHLFCRVGSMLEAARDRDPRTMVTRFHEDAVRLTAAWMREVV